MAPYKQDAKTNHFFLAILFFSLIAIAFASFNYSYASFLCLIAPTRSLIILELGNSLFSFIFLCQYIGIVIILYARVPAVKREHFSALGNKIQFPTHAKSR